MVEASTRAPTQGAPDVRSALLALADAATALRRRFRAAVIHSGTDPEFADEACADIDAQITAARAAGRPFDDIEHNGMLEAAHGPS